MCRSRDKADAPIRAIKALANYSDSINKSLLYGKGTIAIFEIIDDLTITLLIECCRISNRKIFLEVSVTVTAHVSSFFYDVYMS